MLSTTLLTELRGLPRADKLRAIQVLADELTVEELGHPLRESRHAPILNEEPLPPALENDESSLAYRAFLKNLRGEKRRSVTSEASELATNEG